VTSYKLLIAYHQACTLPALDCLDPQHFAAQLSSGSFAKLALKSDSSTVSVAYGSLHDSITYVSSAPALGDHVLLAFRTSKDDSGVT
jgi:hypothetical protein